MLLHLIIAAALLAPGSPATGRVATTTIAMAGSIAVRAQAELNVLAVRMARPASTRRRHLSVRPRLFPAPQAVSAPLRR
ncbi:MAG TPA: hypothetical protein VEJ20_05550 [Candidatus Eremiobacteraceae bacterium]|nr:hypothetical protein [Candidatus Eremiobacteraceae bacterium]